MIPIERWRDAFPGFDLPTLSDDASWIALTGNDAVEAAVALARVRAATLPIRRVSPGSVDEAVAAFEGLSRGGCLIFENLEILNLNRREQALFEDALVFHRKRLQSSTLVVFPSSRRLEISRFCDAEIGLPDFPSDRHALINSLLPADLPIDSGCARSGIVNSLVDASRYWPRSDIVKLVRLSSLFALADDSALSCAHVSRAHRQLFAPGNFSQAGSASHVPISTAHRCSFLPLVDFSAFEGSADAVGKVVSAACGAGGAGGVRVVAISGAPGTGKTLLARLLLQKATPDLPNAFVKASEVLSPVVGESEKNLVRLMRGKRGLIVDDADQLWPADALESTGAIQRLLPTLLHALDHLVNKADCLIILTCRLSSYLHPRLVKRLVADVRLDDCLDSDSRGRLFSRWAGEVEADVINAAVTASSGMNGSGCERLLREAGIKAITRFINKGIKDADNDAFAVLTKDDFK